MTLLDHTTILIATDFVSRTLAWREIHLTQQRLVADIVLEFMKGGEVGKPKQTGVSLVH
jgi:hypothetical protein